MRRRKRSFLLKVSCLLPSTLRTVETKTLQSPVYGCAFYLGDNDRVGDDRESGEEEEGGEEEPEDADEALNVVDGEEKDPGAEEFIDKENESQFCLETNFIDEGGPEDTNSTAEHENGKGKKKEAKNTSFSRNNRSPNIPYL